MSSKLIPPERRLHRADRLDDRLWVVLIEFDVEDVDVGEAFEKDAFPLHDGFRRLCPDVAEPENGGPVRDDADHVPFRCVGVGVGGIFSDSLHGAATPGEYASERSRCVFVGFVVEISIFPADRCGDTPVNPRPVPY